MKIKKSQFNIVNGFELGNTPNMVCKFNEKISPTPKNVETTNPLTPSRKCEKPDKIICNKNTSTQSIQLKNKKKKFKKPLTITVNLKDSSIPIPNILRINKYKYQKSCHRKNNILSNFTSNDQQDTSSTITIGQSIIPDDVKYRRKIVKTKNNVKNQLTKIQSAISIVESVDQDKSINHDDTLIQDESMVSILDEDIPQNSGDCPLPHFYSLRNKVVCVMESKSKFSFCGKLKIKVLYGAVTVYGAVLNKLNTSTPVDVYSPKGSSLIGIQATASKTIDEISYIWDTLKQDNLDSTVSNTLQSDINNIQVGCSVLILQNVDNNLTKFLEIYHPHPLFPRLDDVSNYSWVDLKRAEVILQANIYPENSKRHTINFDRIDNVTQSILSQSTTRGIVESPRVIIAGGKNVGKSTTMRLIVNKMMEKSGEVIVLDLDPGQSEFTPPGCVSLNIVGAPLLGPNFTHLQQPHHQLCVGAIDVTRCLSNYIEGVKQLVDHLNTFTRQRQLPVVVNTMGFCKGIGWDIMCYVIKCLQPSDVIQIYSRRSKNNFNHLLQYSTVNDQTHIWTKWTTPQPAGSFTKYTLHTIDSEAEMRSELGEPWNIESHQQREIVMLAYLSEITNTKKLIPSYERDIGPCINAITPYQVPFSSVKISLVSPVVSHVLSVINGSILALCGVDFDDEQSPEDHSSYPAVLIRAPLATCYGYGILRGVDMEKKKLYINTPLTISELKHVNCLIGCMPVPSGLQQLNKSGVPYTSDECNLPTSRDPRRGYFRMRPHRDTSLVSIV